MTGDSEEVADIVSRLPQFRETAYVPASLIGVVYAALGLQEEAWTYMEEAIREPDPWRILIGVDPRFNVLWNDARLPRVPNRIGLPLPSGAVKGYGERFYPQYVLETSCSGASPVRDLPAMAVRPVAEIDADIHS